MKHRIELTQEQAANLIGSAALSIKGHSESINAWLNDNLDSILKTERVVVTTEIAEEFQLKLGPLSFKGMLQQYTDAIINTQDTPMKKTFVKDGKVWLTHTPGDPMPCERYAKIQVIIDNEVIDQHDESWMWNWSMVEGYRYADEAKMSKAVAEAIMKTGYRLAREDEMDSVWHEGSMFLSGNEWKYNAAETGGCYHTPGYLIVVPIEKDDGEISEVDSLRQQLQEANNLLDRAQEQMNADSLKLSLKDHELQEKEEQKSKLVTLIGNIYAVLDNPVMGGNELESAKDFKRKFDEAQNKVNDLELVLKGQEEWNNRAQKLLDGGRWAGSTYIEGCVTELEESRAKVKELEERDQQWAKKCEQIHDLWNDIARLETLVNKPAQPLPITDPMPPVPEGCVIWYGPIPESGHTGLFNAYRIETDTHYLIVQLPPTPDPLEKERQEFEECFPNLAKSLTPSGMYGNTNTQYVWEGWQARASRV